MYNLTTFYQKFNKTCKMALNITCKALMNNVCLSRISQLFSNLIILFHFRPPGSSYIHYAESSMKNGFGLKYLHRFFNIPFLQLQVRANSQSQRWTLALGQCLSSLASFQVESSHTLHEDFISSRLIVFRSWQGLFMLLLEICCLALTHLL